MGMLIAPETPFGKEMWAWDHHEGESHPSDPKIRGRRPAQFRPYPSRLYKVTGKNPWKWEAAEAKDEAEGRNLQSRGFVMGGLQAACDAYDAGMQDLAQMAAARNYADRNISEAARREVNAAEEASSKHLGEIPSTPIKKRGRPARQVEPA